MTQGLPGRGGSNFTSLGHHLYVFENEEFRMGEAVVNQGGTGTVEHAGMRSEIASGAIASILAGLLTAFPVQLVGGIGYIAWLFTLGATTSTVVGWGFHVLFSALFGGIWAAFGGIDRVQGFVLTPTSGMAGGMFYGVLLWFVNVGFVLPFVSRSVLGYMGVPMPFLVEFGSLVTLIGHMMWGGILGLGYPLVRDKMLA